jgi:hypothetical protein
MPASAGKHVPAHPFGGRTADDGRPASATMGERPLRRSMSMITMLLGLVTFMTTHAADIPESVRQTKQTIGSDRPVNQEEQHVVQ